MDRECMRPNDDYNVAQDGGHTPANGSTEA